MVLTERRTENGKAKQHGPHEDGSLKIDEVAQDAEGDANQAADDVSLHV